MTDSGRATRAYVSAYNRTAVHQSRLYRFEKRRLVANFGALLGDRQIRCATWSIDRPEIGVMSDPQISDDARETSVMFATQLGGWATVRCQITLDSGEQYAQVFRINVRQASWFVDDAPISNGPFSVSVCREDPPPPSCTIYSINEALGTPAAVITESISPGATSATVELAPLDDGNRNRLLVAVVIIDNPDNLSIESVTWGGAVPDYAHPLDNYCMLVACLVDKMEPQNNDLVIEFDDAMTSGGGVKVQPMWYGNVSDLIYAKEVDYVALYGAPDTEGFESVLLVTSFCGIVDSPLEPSPTLKTPVLDFEYTEDDWPNVDMRFAGQKPIARTAVYLGAGTSNTDSAIEWGYDGIVFSTICTFAIMAASLCDGVLEE